MSDKEKILMAINKLIKHDPELADNLTQLADLAEKNQFVYKQAVKKLREL